MSNWDYFKIGDIFKISSGGTPSRSKPEYFENGNIPWVKTGDLKGIYVNFPEEKITELALANSSAKIFPKNTVLLAMYGATIGACSILPFEASTNQACAAFLPADNCNIHYLYYFLTSIKQDLINLGVGGGQPNISAGIIKEIQIPLPPLEQQKKIAAILDAADAYRQKTKALIAKYDELTQSLFLDMFGDPVRNEKGWELKKFSEFTSKYNQGVNTTTEKIIYTENGTFPIIRAGEVGKGQLNFNSVVWVDEENQTRIKGSCKPKFGDVLYANIGANLGTACLVETTREFGIAWNVFRIQLIENINKIFFVYQLNSDSMRKKVWSHVKTATVPFISGKQIAELNFINPNQIIQTQFAARVQAIEKQKAQAQASLEKAEDLFNSLLQRAFKGELA